MISLRLFQTVKVIFLFLWHDISFLTHVLIMWLHNLNSPPPFLIIFNSSNFMLLIVSLYTPICMFDTVCFKCKNSIFTTTSYKKIYKLDFWKQSHNFIMLRHYSSMLEVQMHAVLVGMWLVGSYLLLIRRHACWNSQGTIVVLFDSHLPLVDIKLAFPQSHCHCSCFLYLALDSGDKKIHGSSFMCEDWLERRRHHDQRSPWFHFTLFLFYKALASYSSY